MRKRILSVILTLCLLCALLPAATLPASAEKSGTDIAYPVEGGNIYFDKTTGTITDCDTSVTKADIPSEIDGVAVTSIGDEAFSYCSSLTSVTIPDSVTSIGYGAFDGCSSLTAIHAAAGNTEYSSVNGVLFNKDQSTLLTYPAGKTEAEYRIPGSVTSIGDEAFCHCTSLTNITIPDSVTSIGDLAFCDCRSLMIVTIPNSVTTIGNEAFSHCRSLKSVTIPDSVTSIGGSAFELCDSLKSVTIPNSVTSIGESAFESCSKMTSVTIPDSVTSIGESAFEGCRSLTSVTIPNSVTGIGKRAFSRCYSLTSVTIPSSVTSVGEEAFYDCDSLTSVTIPSSVTSIGERAFSGCSSLTGIWVDENNLYYSNDESGVLFNKDKTELIQTPGAISEYTIPDSVTSIGEHAFERCDSLTSVTIPNSVTSIGEYAFLGCSSLTSVTIPDSVTRIGDSAFSGCGSLTSVTIPDSVTSIGEHAFEWCDSLTSVTIPNGVTSIGDGAFYYCSSLTSVTIPDSVTRIGDSAFSDCRSLTSVTIPDSVTSIGEYAFCNCDSLTSVTIPNSVTGIGDYAFCECSSLTSVTIPNSVTSIGEGAFYDCDSLTSVYFWGNAPKIGESVFQIKDGETRENVNIPNLTLYYIEGKDGWTTPTWNGYPTATWMPVHEHVYAEMVTAPTCTEKGYTTYTCTICGDSYDTYVDALGHDYGDWTQTKEPTCDEKGEEKRTCSRCDVIETREIEANGHTEVVDAAVPATCTEAGKTEGKHCSVCGTVIVAQETVDALGHDYGAWTQTKAPTCIEKGEEKRVCSRCDAFETRELAAHGHTEVVDAAVPATCTETGKTEGKHCSVCGTVIVAQETVGALGHDFGAWTQTKAPTCTEKGAEKRTCSRCDAFETREVEPTGHTEVIDPAVSATCTEAGKTEGKHCSVCNTVLVAQETIAALGHDYGEWTQTIAPTCTEKGEEKRACSRCDAFETREIAAHGHTEVVDPAVSATCTEAGKTEGKHCSVCNTVLVAQETIAPLGHDYGAWTQTKEPTCTEEGEEKRTCSRCDAFETREIAAHGHTEVVDLAVSATCTEAGKTEGKHCSVCNTVLVAQETIAALGHDYGEWTQTIAPTCTEKGEEKRVCSRCDAFETREIAAHGHTEVVDPAVSATCTEAGKTEGKHCSICNTVLVAQETIAPLGHDYGAWTQTKEPTCTEKGEEKRACSRCDVIETREIEANGHTEAVDAAVPATCTEAGKTEGKHCSVCNTVLVAQETIAALGHAWDNGVVTVEPTETKEGVKTFTCTRCGTTKTEPIPVLTHTHSYAAVVTAPTCTEKGYTTNTCACGDSYVDTYVDALGHAWNDGVVTVEPTETEDGEKAFTCTRCDARRTETIPATGEQPEEPCDGGADCPSAKFVDVNPKEWYHPYVDYAVTHGLFSGTSANTFEPEASMTRAMLVTVLWRYEGSPTGYDNPFTDVNAADGSWYIDAVAWAAANKIVEGIGENRFDPDGNVTREQMAAILFRYANKKGIDTSKRGELGSFPDAGKISSYARDAIAWTVAVGVINSSDGRLLPQGDATRAQVSAILMRYIENIVKK